MRRKNKKKPIKKKSPKASYIKTKQAARSSRSSAKG